MMNKKSLRLIFTEKCDRYCPKCCNKDYDFNEYKSWHWGKRDAYYEINITGGEPMLFPHELLSFILRYRALDNEGLTALYLYTASVNDRNMIRLILPHIDGLTVTLHDQNDVAAFERLNTVLNHNGPYDKSLRLSVFEGITLPDKPYPLWNIMRERQWLDNCELPEDEMLILRNNYER